MNRFLKNFVIVIYISIIVLWCSTQKENQYSVSEGNLKLLSMIIIKNTECNSQKEMSFLPYPLDQNEVDTCFYDLYFLDCNQWQQNQLPDSCQFFGIQIR